MNFRGSFANAARSGEKVGAGVAMFVEKSGLGPFDTVRVGDQARTASSR